MEITIQIDDQNADALLNLLRQNQEVVWNPDDGYQLMPSWLDRITESVRRQIQNNRDAAEIATHSMKAMGGK